MGAALGIDYGDARIGLAITDPDRQYALAHGVVKAGSFPAVLETIRAVIERERVDTIVVGLPLKLDGTEGEQAAKTRAFAAQLRGAVGLPLELVDERFTSRAGEDAARLKGSPHADAEAARLVLESWLTRRSHSPTGSQ